LPDIKNSKDGGAGLARSLGIDRQFIDSVYQKYGHYADRVPGIGRALLDREYNRLMNNLEPAATGNRQQRRAAEKKQGGFDKSRYPRV